MRAVAPRDLPPNGPYANAVDIEAWIDRQAPLVAVVNAAIVASGLGTPEQRLGPSFVRATGKLSAYLRLGATWSAPVRAGINVRIYGLFNHFVVWNHQWRRVTMECSEVDAQTLAEDLWQAMLLANIPAESELPHLKDAAGNMRQWCRLGCDLHLGLYGKLYCSCRI